MKLRQLFRFFVPEPASQSVGEQLRSAAAAFIAFILLMLISGYTLQGEPAPLLLASMGASAVILFATYNSPLAQPWSFVGSHLLAATIGITCALWIDQLWLAAAIAVTLSLLLMQRLHCLHPPGCATALVPLLGDSEVHKLGYQLLITPVLLNVSVLLGLALLINRYLLSRNYPYRPHNIEDNPHRLRDPRPQERLGVNHQDVTAALQKFDMFLDVSEDDLMQIYQVAQAHARQRQPGQMHCRDLMSRDLVTVTADTSQQHAWNLLHKHKIKAIPVVNDAHNVIGIITLIDFLKPQGIQPTHGGKRRNSIRLPSLLKRLPFLTTPSETVGSIMSCDVLTAGQDEHLMAIMPQICTTELHHIPVLDLQQRLVGMLTPSDLLVALYTLKEPLS